LSHCQTSSLKRYRRTFGGTDIFLPRGKDRERARQHYRYRLSLYIYPLIYCTMGFTKDVAAKAIETHTKKTYTTSIEDTNLAGIGSDEEAAAKIDFNWMRIQAQSVVLKYGRE